MTRDIVIFGAGGHAREILQIVDDLNAIELRWRCLGFCVDPEHAQSGTLHGLPVHVGIGSLSAFCGLSMVVGVGDPVGRSQIVERLRAVGCSEFPALVHPRAWVASNVQLGPGTVVFAGAALNTDIRIGEHVHVNLNASISHDCVVGNFATLGPGVHLAGRVCVGDRAEIGTGANMIPETCIGHDAVVGAGATVISDVAAHAVVAGVPARVIRIRGEETTR
jgi:sugar O-acyltransferase (sialic acid O-acetyltransferase NeuD family)